MRLGPRSREAVKWCRAVPGASWTRAGLPAWVNWVVNNLALRRRPAIGLGAGTAHQHRPFTIAQTVGLAEGLDGLFEVDDREGAGPVGAPQTAVETPGVEHACERVPDVREGIRFPGQRAGAAETLITAFGRLASASTFGRSAQGCGGAGGVRGCMMPRWSMMNRVSGWRSTSAMPASRLPQHSMLTGKSCRTASRRVRSRPGTLGLRPASLVTMMRMPTVPGVFFQSAMNSDTAGLCGSTGLTRANRPGWARCTSTASVSYTHLTLPTNREVEVSLVAVSS